MFVASGVGAPVRAIAGEAGDIRAGLDAYELMRGVGNLCIGADHDDRYDARRLVGFLVAGLRP